MWLNFVISVGVVAFFLTRMALALKDRERELAAAREGALRNEQILSLGTLAAGAAHQLGTPLGTMAVVVRELELNHGDDAELQEDLLLLREQVDRCKQTISQILASTGQGRDESLRSLALDAYLHRLLDEWQIIRPHARISVTLQGEQPAPLVAADRTLEQAILNLLDNAADANGASPKRSGFRPTGTATAVASRFSIAAQGSGAKRRCVLARRFFSTKARRRRPAASASDCFSATPPSSASVARSNCSTAVTRRAAPAPASPCR
jgi:signal transduction histidine kinase